MDKTRKELIVSSVERDGTLIETVFDPAANATHLVRASQNGMEVLPSITRDGTEYVPPRPGNNLIRHQALLFPSQPAACGSTEALLTEIDAYIAGYVSLPVDARRLATAYVILSWLYDAFRELPYLRFRGDYGTGKTRALLVVGGIAYKPFFASGASTVSPIFHTLDTFKGTLVFDEADFRFTDEKAELVKILNNGNVAGFPVLRTQITKEKEFDPRAFAVFGPKIVGMRGRYEDRALESRFLSIEMEPSAGDGVPINLPEAHTAEALTLRNKLLSFRLRERLGVRLDTTLVDSTLEPRMNQILLPLLSVVPEGAYRDAIYASARSLQAGTVSERGDSAEGHVLSVVRKLSEGKSSLPVSQITAAFVEMYGSEYGRPISNRYVGSLLRRIGLAPFKSHGVYVLALSNARLDALYRRFGIVESEVDIALKTHPLETVG